MKNLFFLLFIALLSFVISEKLKSKASCIAPGKDWIFHFILLFKYVYKDYRYSIKGTKDNQVGWDKSKKAGNKCDWLHHCKKGRKCMSHRCYNV